MAIISLGVHIDGPLIDGRVENAVDQGLKEAQVQVARQGVDEVRTSLYRVVNHGTGNYGRHLQVDRTMSDPRVTDGGIVYGPWLAGTGGRNHKSRFKGYHHWRIAVQRLERVAGDIAAHVIDQYLGRL
jgi:hypothetical protein